MLVVKLIGFEFYIVLMENQNIYSISLTARLKNSLLLREYTNISPVTQHAAMLLVRRATAYCIAKCDHMKMSPWMPRNCTWKMMLYSTNTLNLCCKLNGVKDMLNETIRVLIVYNKSMIALPLAKIRLISEQV